MNTPTNIDNAHYVLGFPRVSRTHKSYRQTKFIYGIGLNDSSYLTSIYLADSTESKCPIFSVWRSMIQRCYSKDAHKKNPTYKGCTVATEWQVFSNFERWYLANYFKGCQLDKDLKVKGNRIYSPDTCLLVPRQINTVILGTSSTDPNAGIWYRNSTKNFEAKVVFNGTPIYLGVYRSREAARTAYKVGKYLCIASAQKAYPEYAEWLEQHKPDVSSDELATYSAKKHFAPLL